MVYVISRVLDTIGSECHRHLKSEKHLKCSMSIQTCMKIVTLAGYASGPGLCILSPVVHTRMHMVDCTFTVFVLFLDRSIGIRFNRL